MMNILDEIIVHKRVEVERQKQICSVNELQKKRSSQPPLSFSQSLLNKEKNGIVAEFKRQSPSKGIINHSSTVQDVVVGYQQAGVSAISILTDEQYFGGSLLDLERAVPHLTIPILRKDFIIDSYQILEARAFGASAILLIAAVLSKEEIETFTTYAHSLQLEVLFEVHSVEEIYKGCSAIDVYGVNNRNLHTFEVDIQQSILLLPHLPTNKPLVSESGIDNIFDLVTLRNEGFKGFLMGENFMRRQNPAEYCKQFSKKLKELKS